MITLEISFAWILSLMMIVGIVTIIIGIIFQKLPCVVIGILLLFGCDFFCVLGSLAYRSHPTNGDEIGRVDSYCSSYNWSVPAYDPMVACVAPTPETNPYEQQPIHPLAWIWGCVVIVCYTLTGAISLKVT